MEIYSFKIQSIKGEEFDFSTLKGKKILIVNVASECGFTKQYAQLQELYEQFAGQLEIIGIPCNDFGGQEPGAKEEIVNFCRVNYGVTFSITEKVGIKHNMHPIYLWLTDAVNNNGIKQEVTWNFCKFLVNEEGLIEAFLPSNVEPLDEQILTWLS